MSDLRPGDLVEITRASVGVPAGTIALVIEQKEPTAYIDSLAHKSDWPDALYTVWPTGEVGKRGIRRYLGRDLKRLTKT